MQSGVQRPLSLGMRAKHYVVVARKGGRVFDRVFDVQVIEPGRGPRVLNTFNREADAWQWINEQQFVERFARRMT
jgi:hypothetical protein